MRTLFALVLVASLGSAVHAEDAAGSYDVKFEEMGHNCSPPPVALLAGRLRRPAIGLSLPAGGRAKLGGYPDGRLGDIRP